jgi:hypothetical protein
MKENQWSNATFIFRDCYVAGIEPRFCAIQVQFRGQEIVGRDMERKMRSLRVGSRSMWDVFVDHGRQTLIRRGLLHIK